MRMMSEIHMRGEKEEQIKNMISACSLLFSREFGVVFRRESPCVGLVPARRFPAQDGNSIACVGPINR